MLNTTVTPPASAAQVALLTPPLAEFIDRVSAPANLSVTLHRLFFEYLGHGGTLLPDEAQNLNSLFDFLSACQVACGATFVVAQA